MNYSLRVKIEFTAYMKAVIQNSATDYKRKLLKSITHEISVADFSNVPNELLSVYDDGSFLLDDDIAYENIENLFENKKYYEAMKSLSDKEKLVIYLTVIQEHKAEQVAKIMNTTKENVRKIKSRAIKQFLSNLSDEK